VEARQLAENVYPVSRILYTLFGILVNHYFPPSDKLGFVAHRLSWLRAPARTAPCSGIVIALISAR